MEQFPYCPIFLHLSFYSQRRADLHQADAAQGNISVNAAPEQVIMKLYILVHQRPQV